MPMATKLGMMATYFEQLLPTNFHDHVITWFCKITSQTKYIILSSCMSSFSPPFSSRFSNSRAQDIEFVNRYSRF